MTHTNPNQCAFCKFASATVRKLQYHIVNMHYNREPSEFHAVLCRTIKPETPAKRASRCHKSERDYERRMAVPAAGKDVTLAELLKRLDGMMAQKG